MAASVYETVTATIIDDLEKDAAPWIKPWKTHLPYNAVSQKEYRGINVLLLWYHAYQTPAWLTFKQARALGGHVKKGEKATRIVYASTFIKKDSDERGEETSEEIRFLKWYYVFNVEQCEGLPERLYWSGEQQSNIDLHPHIEVFLGNTGIPVIHGGGEAYYRPQTDEVHLPLITDFTAPEHYYATSLHKHVHASGHASRLNRELCGRFGDPRYAFEELIALS